MDGNHSVGYPSPNSSNRNSGFDSLRGGEEFMACIANATNQALRDLGLAHGDGANFLCPNAFNPSGSNPGAQNFVNAATTTTGDNPGCYTPLGPNPSSGYNPNCTTGACGYNVASNYNSASGPASYFTGGYSPANVYGGAGYGGGVPYHTSSAYNGPPPFPIGGYFPGQFGPTGFGGSPYGPNVSNHTAYNAMPYYTGYNAPPCSGGIYRPQPRIFNLPPCGPIGHRMAGYGQPPIDPYTYGADASNIQIAWPNNAGAVSSCQHGAPCRSVCGTNLQSGAQGQSSCPSCTAARQSCACQGSTRNVCGGSPAGTQASCHAIPSGTHGSCQKIQTGRSSCPQHSAVHSACACYANAAPDSSATAEPAITKGSTAIKSEPGETNASNKNVGNRVANVGPEGRANPACGNPSTASSPHGEVPAGAAAPADALCQRTANPSEQNPSAYRIINVGDLIPPGRMSGGDFAPGAFAVPVIYSPPGVQGPALNPAAFGAPAYNQGAFNHGPISLAPIENTAYTPAVVNPAVLSPATLSGGGLINPAGPAGSTYAPIGFAPSGAFNTAARSYNPPIFNNYNPGIYNPSASNPGTFAPTGGQSSTSTV